jgi:hypothetical protein
VHDRDGGTTNGSGDSKQTTSTRDRGDSIIGVYWWQTMYEEKIKDSRFEKLNFIIYEHRSKIILRIMQNSSYKDNFEYIFVHYEP